jgi:hypothetical protein
VEDFDFHYGGSCQLVFGFCINNKHELSEQSCHLN